LLDIVRGKAPFEKITLLFCIISILLMLLVVSDLLFDTEKLFDFRFLFGWIPLNGHFQLKVRIKIRYSSKYFYSINTHTQNLLLFKCGIIINCLGHPKRDNPRISVISLLRDEKSLQ